MTKQKKPKTGDTLDWLLVSESGQVLEQLTTREAARKGKRRWSRDGNRYYIGRIKIVA